MWRRVVQQSLRQRNFLARTVPHRQTAGQPGKPVTHRLRNTLIGALAATAGAFGYMETGTELLKVFGHRSDSVSDLMDVLISVLHYLGLTRPPADDAPEKAQGDQPQLAEAAGPEAKKLNDVDQRAVVPKKSTLPSGNGKGAGESTGGLAAMVKSIFRGKVDKQNQHFVLEQTLRDALAAAHQLVYEAVAELGIAAEKIDEFSTSLMNSLEEPIGGEDHSRSQAATEARDRQAAARKLADSRVVESHKALQKLQDTVRRGQVNPVTKDNGELQKSEEELAKLQEMLDAASAKAARSLKRLDLSEQLGHAIEDSKRQLIDEVNHLLPEGKSFSDPKSLSLDDLNLLVVHAHKRIQALQRELTLNQLKDQDQKAELDAQREPGGGSGKATTAPTAHGAEQPPAQKSHAAGTNSGVAENLASSTPNL